MNIAGWLAMATVAHREEGDFKVSSNKFSFFLTVAGWPVYCHAVVCCLGLCVKLDKGLPMCADTGGGALCIVSVSSSQEDFVAEPCSM